MAFWILKIEPAIHILLKEEPKYIRIDISLGKVILRLFSDV